MLKENLIYLFVKDIWLLVGARYILYISIMLVTGFTEGLALASAVPLLSAAGMGGSLTDSSVGMAGLAVNILGFFGVLPTPGSIVTFLLLTLLVGTCLFLAQAYLGSRLQTNYVYDWQRRLIEVAFLTDLKFIQGRRNGDIINAIVAETQRLGGAFYQLGLLLTGVLHSLIFFIVAFSLSPTVTFSVLLGGASLFILTRPLIYRAYTIGMGISKSSADFQAMATDFISGTKLIRATATENQAILRLLSVANKLRSHIFNNSFDIQIAKGVFDFGAASMIACIIFISYIYLKTDSAITLVVLAIFIRLMPKLAGIQQSLQSLSLSIPAVQVVNEIASSAKINMRESVKTVLPTSLKTGAFNISLQGVEVKFGDTHVLKNININIPAGACIALVGGSGAGKSTLVDSLLGLVQLSDGHININECPLYELPLDGFRRRVGYMAQDTVLFDGTLMDNILWGQPDAFSGSAARVAADRSAATDFIMGLPAGFETMVGNGGSSFSGGERQRLGLARALAGSPALLILDEATSALDAETEAIVVSALRQIKGQVTIIMIAHRLSSISLADQIYVMDHGSIVESGTWEELIAKDGSFNSLWKLQTKINGSEL